MFSKIFVAVIMALCTNSFFMWLIPLLIPCLEVIIGASARPMLSSEPGQVARAESVEARICRRDCI